MHRFFRRGRLSEVMRRTHENAAAVEVANSDEPELRTEKGIGRVNDDANRRRSVVDRGRWRGRILIDRRATVIPYDLGAGIRARCRSKSEDDNSQYNEFLPHDDVPPVGSGD